MAFWRGLPIYEYQPLDPSQNVFRLIRLLAPRPSLPGLHGTLRIELLTTSVAADIPYDALSYAWDVPARASAPDRRIIIETSSGPHELPIYRSLEVALRQLVSSAAVSHPLFVDQICINQRDDQEKSHQVSLMRDIYSSCARTVVWLGASTALSDAFFDFVTSLSHEAVLSRVMGPRVGHFMRVFDAVMDPGLPLATAEEVEDRDDILSLIQRFGPTFPLAGYAEVLDRRWFNRLWVIQEACLSPLVVFACGGKSLCFDCLRSGALFYSLYNTHWVRNTQGPSSRRELRSRDAIFGKTTGLIRIFQERKAIHQTGERGGLLDLVLKYNVNHDKKKIGASLDADRIFGLLALVASSDSLGPRVRVRYDEEAAATFTHVAALLLEESIDTLLYAQFPKKTAVPSWVPDWAMDLSLPLGYTAPKQPVFAAGGPHSTARFRLDAASSRLTIRGVSIDAVSRLGHTRYRTDPNPQVQEQIDYRSAQRFFTEAADFSSDDDQALRLCDSALSHRHFTATLGPDAGLVRLRALHAAISTLGQRLIASDATVANHHPARILRNARLPSSVSALWRFLCDVACLLAASARVTLAAYHIKLRRRFGGVTLRPAAEAVARVGIDPDVAFGADMGVFLSNLLRNTNKSLYATVSGCVGVGPAKMRVGDVLVVFHGGTTAHFVRSVGGDLFEYVGEAYCDGIMDGEAVREGGVGVERDFVLI